MRCVIGIDGGGSKTVCVLMDDTGTVLGRGEGGAANYHSVGMEAALLSIQSAIAQSIPSTTQVTITGICLGLAGVDRPADLKVAQGLLQQLLNSHLPIIWKLSPNNILICNDALIALVGGLGHPVGIVAIAGTGSIIFGRNSQGQTKRVGGWGYLLGDEGGAYYLAIQGMQAALKAYDGRLQSTSLQDKFIQHLQLKSIEDLITVIYQHWGVKEIAKLASIVDQAASEGDLVANNIINHAAEELATATQVVIDSIFNNTEVIEVVTAGSVWQGKSQLREKYVSLIKERSPLVQVQMPLHEPAYGAALLALFNNL